MLYSSVNLGLTKDARKQTKRWCEIAVGLLAAPRRAVLSHSADWQWRGQVPARCGDVMLSSCH